MAAVHTIRCSALRITIIIAAGGGLRQLLAASVRAVPSTARKSITRWGSVMSVCEPGRVGAAGMSELPLALLLSIRCLLSATAIADLLCIGLQE